ncbi:ABC transporter ATP-binding protein [Pseudoalteromonas rubra]|uniref:ABC transporter ATP-binding protein n=1 Tax=Pseudoalteromonas rubra TaxID=43658 RepID=UPI00138E33FD|nr:ABC transporter ATP-binding protein [Pseudoalteromonas rubra]
MHDNNYVIHAKNVRKQYGHGASSIDALLGVDLSVEYGQVVSILGPNGAGKTTLIEIIEGLRKSDSGSISILGQDIADLKAVKHLRERIGISPQHSVLPPLLTIEELLTQQATFYDKPQNIDYLITRLGLDDKRHFRIGNLSGGQQQRVTVALALIGDPDLIFLDEPTSQLDPQAKRAVWELLDEQRKHKCISILMTTHQMEEAQQCSDRVVILDGGRVLADDKPSGLIAKYTPSSVLEFVTNMDADLHFLPGETQKVNHIDNTQKVRLITDDPNDYILKLVEMSKKDFFLIRDLRVQNQSLEDVFIQITGREMRS